MAGPMRDRPSDADSACQIGKATQIKSVYPPCRACAPHATLRARRSRLLLRTSSVGGSELMDAAKGMHSSQQDCASRLAHWVKSRGGGRRAEGARSLTP